MSTSRNAIYNVIATGLLRDTKDFASACIAGNHAQVITILRGLAINAANASEMLARALALELVQEHIDSGGSVPTSAHESATLAKKLTDNAGVSANGAAPSSVHDCERYGCSN